ncbi:MAG: hypothetical protein QOJ24_2845 [Mycobacterium sp.]|nr:hypothetical protein [Mycobacterium sp.]
MTEQTADQATQEESKPVLGYAIAGVVVVVALGALARFLEQEVPLWAAGTPFPKVAMSIEFRSTPLLWAWPATRY